MPAGIDTLRLRLRQWRDEDLEPLAAMNADPEVMRHFASPGSREGSLASLQPRRALPFMPCVEIGWRLARAHWGQGLASEAAAAVLRVGFEQVGLDEIVSFTSRVNVRSQAVMQRIGLRDSGEDFEHPALPEGSELRRHCLYRLARQGWQEQRPGR